MKWSLLVLLVATTLPAAAVAQEGDLVSVDADRDSYESGDIIVVSGMVWPVLSGHQMQMTITGDNRLVEVAQFDVALDGTYTYTVNTSGPKWNYEGEYVIQVQYGQETDSLIFDFAVVGSDETVDIFEVADGRGGTFDVGYVVRGGTVNDMVVDYENLAIRITLESERDGSLLLELPRQYIDAVGMSGEDEDYIVLADGSPTAHVDDDMGEEVRRVLVTFPAETAEIMIIGTQVVPEFGIVLAVLAAGVAATAVAARSGRLRIGTFA